ncbi:MAG: RCC1 repeat-containing protein, partial [Deltaproteobacteria bacterium]|nr:RCC1 repeat-containing protein [Deltaproteobacteria bacterium]
MLAIAGAAALLGGCVSKTPFQCQQDEQCVSSGVAGRCELEGFCSFPDAECEEGFRFGESAGDLSGECVSADPVTTVCLAAQQLTIGSAHTCLLDVGGVVYCWGANFEGELGDGTTISRSSPARVAGLPGTMTQVAAGDDATCALDADGFVWCWGENDYGKLGTGGPATSDGEPEYRASPAVVLGLTGAIAITVGDEHMCAVLADGTAKCWGSNSSGRLGRPGSSTSTPLNVVVDDERTPLSGVTAIAAGLEHTCVIVDGGVKCWGLGDEGQLGDGQLTTSNLPVDVVGLAGTAVALTAGNNHTCALTDSGQAFCWGANADGQIGDGTVGDPSAVATLVGAGLAVASIEAGHAHTCARGDDSTVYCWGDNSRGQLGNGDTEGQDVTAPIPVLDDSQLVAAGGRHSCAIDASGSMQCWG